MIWAKILSWLNLQKIWMCVAALAISAFIGAWFTYEVVSADHKVQLAEIDKEQYRLKEENAKLIANASEKTVEIVTKYVDRVKIVKQKGDTIVKEVPVYITEQANDQCILTEGFASVHDSAAKNVPIPAAVDVNARIEISLSDAAKTIASNYTTCHEIREQLVSLQEWVRVNTDKEATK